MTAKQFLCSFYGTNSTDFFVNYRIAKGYVVQSLPFDRAVKQLEQDIQEMTEFFHNYNADVSKAKEATFSLWEKSKLVRFN